MLDNSALSGVQSTFISFYLKKNIVSDTSENTLNNEKQTEYYYIFQKLE